MEQHPQATDAHHPTVTTEASRQMTGKTTGSLHPVTLWARFLEQGSVTRGQTGMGVSLMTTMMGLLMMAAIYFMIQDPSSLHSPACRNATR